MLKAVGTVPCECQSALTSESRTALTSERPSALAKLLRENNGDEEIIRLRSALDMLDRENAELKKQNEYLEERVCCLEKRLWENSGKNAEKLRDMTSFPSAESSESAEE